MQEQTTQGKSAFIAVVGRPSVGKSTLMNRMCGRKISIVSPVPQTTRNRVRGIYTDERGQLVFIDTPGYHDSERKFNMYMKNLVDSTLVDADLILRVVDLSRPEGREESAIGRLLEPYLDRTVVALNKADLVAADESVTPPVGIEDAQATVPVSAKAGTGVKDLLGTLFALAPSGTQLYPSEFYTDQEPTFRFSEIIREQAMLRTREELPHSLYVDISDLKEGGDGQTLIAEATIFVERESQKGIVVGRGGKMIQKIRSASEQELTEIFERPVQVHLRVKVHPKWRTKDETIRKVVR